MSLPAETCPSTKVALWDSSCLLHVPLLRCQRAPCWCVSVCGAAPYDFITTPTAAWVAATDPAVGADKPSTAPASADECEVACKAASLCQYYAFREDQDAAADNGCFFKLAPTTPTTDTFVTFKLWANDYVVWPVRQLRRCTVVSLLAWVGCSGCETPTASSMHVIRLCGSITLNSPLCCRLQAAQNEYPTPDEFKFTAADGVDQSDPGTCNAACDELASCLAVFMTRDANGSGWVCYRVDGDFTTSGVVTSAVKANPLLINAQPWR